MNALSYGVRRGGFALQFLLVRYTRSTTLLAVLAVMAGLATAWIAAYALGGSRTAAPHLFYLPVILAAIRHSWPGATLTALAAGLLAGPALPADVADGLAQPLHGWLLRLGIFLAVGVLVAWLVRDQSEPMGVRLQAAMVSNRLVRAVGQGRIAVYYQPILDMREGRITSVEALARWDDPRRGRISPDEFIPAAERTGAIAYLDRFVLREAAHQAQAWSTAIAPVGVSVNVSATRFRERDLPAQVATVLRETGLAAQALQLEITESAIIDDITSASRQVEQLRALGVRIAIDDFGAGQSSLTYLNDLVVDTVKIDRSLVAQLSTPRTERLVSAFIGMFHALDLNIVVEGVENASQYAHLQSRGCQHAQGFYIAPRQPAQETETLLRGPRSPAAQHGCLASNEASP